MSEAVNIGPVKVKLIRIVDSPNNAGERTAYIETDATGDGIYFYFRLSTAGAADWAKLIVDKLAANPTGNISFVLDDSVRGDLYMDCQFQHRSDPQTGNPDPIDWIEYSPTPVRHLRVKNISN